MWARTDGKSATCCLRASDAEINEDPDAYDCENCEVRAMEESLTAGDRIALQAYRLLSRPVIRRLHLQALVFDALGLSMRRQDVLTFIAQLDVIEQDVAEQAANDGAGEQSSADEE